MCGRFVASSPAGLIADLFACQVVALDDDRPRWNVAPTDAVRAVVSRDGVRALETRRWGLVPHWASSPHDAAKRINARAETVHELPAFRDAFARTRCLIPADGFYEWRKRPDGTTQPCFVRAVDGRPVAFAGLRATWQASADAPPLRTCTIVTTVANRRLAPLHDRMPVILPADVQSAWLDSRAADVGWLRTLLVPAPEDLLEVVPVGTGVNNVRNDGPWLVERAAEPVQDALPF